MDANPDGLALICADSRWTWRTLDGLSDRLAVGLLGLGLNPGDRVASLMPDRPALIVHYLACFKAGLVATPLNYRYMAPEIDHALAVSGARALLAHVERGEDLAASQLARQISCDNLVSLCVRVQICRVDVERSPHPVFLLSKDIPQQFYIREEGAPPQPVRCPSCGELIHPPQFYVRKGNASRPLDVQRAHE